MKRVLFDLYVILVEKVLTSLCTLVSIKDGGNSLQVEIGITFQFSPSGVQEAYYPVKVKEGDRYPSRAPNEVR